MERRQFVRYIKIDGRKVDVDTVLKTRDLFRQALASERFLLMYLLEKASDEDLLFAVRVNGWNLAYIPYSRQTDAMMEQAVLEDPDSISFCKTQSRKLQLLAVTENPYAIRLIRVPHRDTLFYLRAQQKTVYKEFFTK